MGKGRARSGVPSRAPFPRVRGSAAKGERVLGAACPRAPLPRKRGGAKREGEESGSGGDVERRRCALVRPPFARMGKGGGWPASRAPFRAYRAARTRGKGRGRRGVMGESAPVRPPSAQMGKGGGRVPPFRAYRCCGQGKGRRRRHALVRHPS
ncbi:hypothetical protein EDB85DRAFT_2009192, partial [Lactarius pseudohatsudake]